jgi:hypothetical protein
MADVIKFYFLLLVLNHECTRVEMCCGKEATEYIVVVLNLHLLACHRWGLCILIQNVTGDIVLFLLFLT